MSTHYTDGSAGIKVRHAGTNPIPLIKEARRLEGASRSPSMLRDAAELRKEAAILIRERGLGAEGRGSTHAAESLARISSRLKRSAARSIGAANRNDRIFQEIAGSSQSKALYFAMHGLFEAVNRQTIAVNNNGSVFEQIMAHAEAGSAARSSIAVLDKFMEGATAEVRGMLERSFFTAVNIALSSYVTAAELSVGAGLKNPREAYIRTAQNIIDRYGFNDRYLPQQDFVVVRLRELQRPDAEVKV